MVFRVSTSEVATFLTCKQRWMYAHHPSYHLEPRTLGIALTRGLIGHEALELYYKAKMNGKNEDNARKQVNDFILKKGMDAIIMSDGEKAKMISELGVRLVEYLDKGQGLLRDRDIIGVENVVSAPLPGCEEIHFAGRIDITAQITSGINKGEVEPYDHKFTYNFWPKVAIELNAQISNYIWSLREMGYRSRNGYLNMIRYRADAQEKFLQEPVPTVSAMRNTFIKNHAEAAKIIVDLKHKPKVGLAEGVTRSTSKFNCEYCPFSDLCLAESRGLDTTLKVKASYRPNSYGYDSELDVA